MKIHTSAQIDLIDDEVEIRKVGSPLGKPFLRMTFGDQTVDITTNLAEMIGGAGSGLRKRHEDSLRQAH